MTSKAHLGLSWLDAFFRQKLEKSSRSENNMVIDAVSSVNFGPQASTNVARTMTLPPSSNAIFSPNALGNIQEIVPRPLSCSVLLEPTLDVEAY